MTPRPTPSGRARRAAVGLGVGGLAGLGVVWALVARSAWEVEAPPATSVRADPSPVEAAESRREGSSTGPRVGLGGLRWRFVRAADREPVAGFPAIVEREGPGDGPGRRIVWSEHDGRAEVDGLDVATTHAMRAVVGAWEGASRQGLTLEPGRTRDLGDVALGALGALDVVVVDGAGRPVAAALVAASIDPEVLVSSDVDPWPLPAEPARPLARGATDAHGRTRLEGIPPGLVAVRATHAAWRGATARTAVPAGAAETASVVLVLSRPHGVFLRVSDEGRAVEGATVEAGPDGLDAFHARVRGLTDAEGRVALLGFASGVVADLRVDLGPRGTYVLRRAGVDVEYRLEVDRAEVLTVTVVDEADRPVEGARVGVRAAARCRPATPSRTPGRASAGPAVEAVGSTDARGQAALPVARDVTGPTWVVHPAYDVVGRPPLAWAEGRPPRGESEDLPSPRVVLRRPEDLFGRVQDPGGRPVGGARVALLGRDGGDVVATAVADAAGGYTLHEVVSLRTPFLTAASSDGSLFGSSVLPLRLPGSTYPVEVAPARVLVGHVVDAAGAPVEGATVRVVDVGLAGTTAADGGYRLQVPRHGPRDGGVVLVAAYAVGVGAAGASVAVGPRGVPVEVPLLTLGATPSLEGFAVDPAGDGVAFPVIDLVDEGGTARRIAAADAFGRFVVRDVPLGRWVVRARTPDRVGVAVEVADVGPPPAPAPRAVRIVLRAGTAVTGQVLDRHEVPVAGACVRARFVGDGAGGRATYDETRTDALGQFRLVGLGRADEVEASFPAAAGDARPVRARPRQGEPSTIVLR